MALTIPRFDKDMPYGECTPILNGIAFWQAPHHYDINLNPVSVPDGRIIENHAEAIDGEDDGDIGASATPAIDLKKWAAGEINVPFRDVRLAMQDAGFNPVPASKEEAKMAIRRTA